MLQSQARQIGAVMSAKEYFFSEESKALDTWQEEAQSILTRTGSVLMQNYSQAGSNLVRQSKQANQELHEQSTMQFEAMCILNRKVHLKEEAIENFASFFNGKNHKRTFFIAWKTLAANQQRLRTMETKADKYKINKTMRSCLKEWTAITMLNVRSKIKNKVLANTESEISRIQNEYEKIIAALELNLEKKLVQLKKQQEEHKLLHDKYQTMYSRRQAK